MEDSSKLQELGKAINALVDEYQDYFYADRLQKLKPEVDKFIKELDSLTQIISESKKQQRAKLFLLKARLLDLLPEYEKSAEDYLNKSIKLNPVDGECWNTLGHVLWKKSDFDASKNAFEMAIENCGKNKVTLRYQSILLRSMGKSIAVINQDEQRRVNVKNSLELAKEALKLDLKDGQSWYLVGNAWMSNFFVNYGKLSELQTAIKAYNQAEKYLKHGNPDLHINRGNCYKYTEDYQQASKDFLKAVEIENSEQAKENLASIDEKVKRYREIIEQSKTLKPKKLASMIKSIPLQTPNKRIFGLKSLKPGLNKGVYFAGKVFQSITKNRKDQIPQSFVVVDANSTFCCLSIYNIGDAAHEQISQGADIVVAQPLLKTINVGGSSYQCVQVFELNKLLVNGTSITDKFAPNVVVNETFQK